MLGFHGDRTCVELVEHAPGFVWGEDGWQAPPFTGAQGIDWFVDGPFDDVAAEKWEGMERPVLGGRRHVALGSQVCEEGFRLGFAHGGRMVLVEEEDSAANPADVAILGGVRVIAQAQSSAGLVEELLGFACMVVAIGWVWGVRPSRDDDIWEFFGILSGRTIITRCEQDITAWRGDHPTFVA